MKKIKWKPVKIACRPRSIEIELSNTQLDSEFNWESVRKILLDLCREHPYWIFRGMSNEFYQLQTSLERKQIDRGLRKGLYQELLESFGNSVHEYRDVEYIPAKHEKLELQSLMQHYGAPTAMLDWTYSPYVASYFATNDALDNQSPNGVLYALNALAIYKTLEQYFRSHCIIAEDVLFDSFSEMDVFNAIVSYQCGPGDGFILPIEPKRTNKRLRVQQGLFTINGNVFYSFEENLALLTDFALDNNPQFDPSQVMRRIPIRSDYKQHIQEDLLLMNITAASLFPGLEGFSKSWNQVMLQKQLRVTRFFDSITGRSTHR